MIPKIQETKARTERPSRTRAKRSLRSRGFGRPAPLALVGSCSDSESISGRLRGVRRAKRRGRRRIGPAEAQATRSVREASIGPMSPREVPAARGEQADLLDRLLIGTVDVLPEGRLGEQLAQGRPLRVKFGV